MTIAGRAAPKALNVNVYGRPDDALEELMNRRESLSLSEHQ